MANENANPHFMLCKSHPFLKMNLDLNIFMKTFSNPSPQVMLASPTFPQWLSIAPLQILKVFRLYYAYLP